MVSNFICQALCGEDITIFGDGLQTRSFCYVDDLVSAFGLLMCSNSDITGPINLCNLNEFTILELAEKVLSIVASSSELIFK